MKKITKILSYVLVAVLASVITMSAAGGTSTDSTATKKTGKLDELALLIDTYFIEEPDVAAMEDAGVYAIIIIAIKTNTILNMVTFKH